MYEYLTATMVGNPRLNPAAIVEAALDIPGIKAIA